MRGTGWALRALVSKFIPTLLMIPVYSLSIGVAYPADAPHVTVRIAANSALDPAALPRAANHQRATSFADFNETPGVAVVATPLLSEERSDTHVSPTGIGALYWAAHHPTQAWRVLLPIQPDDGFDAAADIRARCAIFADALSGRAAC